jgi:hypothetical protein
VKAIAKDDEIGQQITRLLSGQLQGLIIALDLQSTKGVQSQHLGPPLFRWPDYITPIENYKRNASRGWHTRNKHPRF